MVRLAPAHIEGSAALTAADLCAAPQEEAPRHVVDSRDLCPQRLEIDIFEIDGAPGAMALIGQRGLASAQRDRVGRIIPKLPFDPVPQPVASRDQQHQQKDSPGHAGGGEAGTQLVAPQYLEHFLPGVHAQLAARWTRPSRSVMIRSVRSAMSGSCVTINMVMPWALMLRSR